MDDIEVLDLTLDDDDDDDNDEEPPHSGHDPGDYHKGFDDHESTVGRSTDAVESALPNDGAEKNFEVVELLDSSDEEAVEEMHDEHDNGSRAGAGESKGGKDRKRRFVPRPPEKSKPRNNSHPRRVLEASRKRKAGQGQQNQAVKKRAADKTTLPDKNPRSAAGQRNVVDLSDPGNIPGGCNFIIIDDDSSEDNAENIEMPQPEAKRDSRKHQRGQHGPGKKAPRQQQQAPHPRFFRWPLKKNKTTQQHAHPQAAGATDANLQRSRSSGGRSFSARHDYSYGYTREDAREMQERMFRESAARVRSQGTANAHVVVHVRSAVPVPDIVEPIQDIATKHPEHWKWKDPFSCLGLPKNASLALVKSQYRRLARVYHPDKSKVADTASKFHAITSAYRKLTSSASP